mgnify:CR=1 FL=1
MAASWRYTADLTTVQTGLQAEVAAGQFTGDTLTHVNTILADITTALSAATASVNGGGDVRQRRGGRNGVAHQPSRHPQYRQQRSQSRRRWRRKTARPDFSPRPRRLPTASRPRPRLTPISPRSASSSTIVASHILGGVNADNAAHDHALIRTLSSPTCRP